MIQAWPGRATNEALLSNSWCCPFRLLRMAPGRAVTDGAEKAVAEGGDRPDSCPLQRYRRVRAELKLGCHVSVSRTLVYKLMHEQNLKGLPVLKGRKTSS